MAAEDLRQVAEVDSGFYIYRKRVVTYGTPLDSAMIYEPWGVFAGQEDGLSDLLANTPLRESLKQSMLERWILVEDLPEPLRDVFQGLGILECGLWPLMSREVMIGTIVVGRTKAPARLTMETSTAVLDACAAQVSVALDLILAIRLAEDMGQRDMLTGLLNRRGLEARLPQLLEEAEKTGKHLVLGLIDLDDLKRINDSFGHPAGDEALRKVAASLGSWVGGHDLVARLGGDEFAVVVQIDGRECTGVCALLKAVAESSEGYSVSVGGALWGQDGANLEECYAIADRRLYEFKRQSRLRHTSFT